MIQEASVIRVNSQTVGHTPVTQRHSVSLEAAQGVIDRQHILVGQPFPWLDLAITPEGIMQREPLLRCRVQC